MPNPITFSAPGSLMLLGEHAVLHGRLAVVCAINRRARVTLVPREDRKIFIRSSLGEHDTDLETIAPHPKLKFVMAAIADYRDRLRSGFDLEFRSEFSHTVGFGSSAAVTVITHAALRCFLGDAGTPPPLAAAIKTIRDVQGTGSGADVAASVLGGIVFYRANPIWILGRDSEAVAHPLTAVYSGSKMPTPEVIAIVEERRRAEPERFEEIFRAMERTSLDAMKALEEPPDWPRLGRILDEGGKLMEALGVSNEILGRIVSGLRADPGILGAKISGSGLGDCAVGLGRARNYTGPGETMPVDIEVAGVRRETT